MSSNDNKTTYQGVTFLELLGLLFICLKLTGYIEWPWWAVLVPIWIPLAIWAIMLLAALVLYAVAWILKALGK